MIVIWPCLLPPPLLPVCSLGVHWLTITVLFHGAVTCAHTVQRVVLMWSISAPSSPSKEVPLFNLRKIVSQNGEVACQHVAGPRFEHVSGSRAHSACPVSLSWALSTPGAVGGPWAAGRGPGPKAGGQLQSATAAPGAPSPVPTEATTRGERGTQAQGALSAGGPGRLLQR